MEWLSAALIVVAIVVGSMVGLAALGFVLYSWHTAGRIARILLDAYPTRAELVRVEDRMAGELATLREEHEALSGYVHDFSHTTRGQLHQISLGVQLLLRDRGLVLPPVDATKKTQEAARASNAPVGPAPAAPR